MRSSRNALLALLILVLTSTLASGALASTTLCAPSAAGLTTVCASDASASDGSCATQGYAFGYDTAYAITPVGLANVYAGSFCYTDATLVQRGTAVQAAAFNPVFGVVVEWSSVHQESGGSVFDGCTVLLVVGTSLGWNTLEQPCPAGLAPPDAGWGHLLP